MLPNKLSKYSMNASFRELTAKLFTMTSKGNKPLVSNPKFKTVHVAGTNGKGSVTVKIGKALELAGYKTGVFTSPHIFSFCERIQINGKLISEEDVVRYLTEIFNLNVEASFFEITTLMAFKYFEDNKVDFAVIETGLGGRLDATNVIIPELIVITSISLDHTELLGNTLEEIAFEKSGIIKLGIPVVLGPNTPFVTRREPYFEVAGTFKTTEDENRAIAKKGMEILGVYHPEALEAFLPCRMQKFTREGVEIILDVAHNPDGLKRLMETLENIPLRIIFGMSRSKDLATCAEIIKKKSSHIYLVEVPGGRGYKMSELKEYFPNGHHCPSLNEALKLAIKAKETVLVCGSCYLFS